MNSLFESATARRPDPAMHRRWQDEDALARQARERARYLEDLGVRRYDDSFSEGRRQFDERMNVLRALMNEGGGFEALPTMPVRQPRQMGMRHQVDDGIDRGQLNNALARLLMTQMGGSYRGR